MIVSLLLFSVLALASDIPEDITERYTCGRCMWLALALHRRFGWPIKAQMYCRGDEYLAHVYVVHPSGFDIDIYGPEFEMPMYGDKTRDFTEEELLEYLSCVSREKIEQEIAQASVDIECYVIPRLEAEGLI
jgi:hypothetical protein